MSGGSNNLGGLLVAAGQAWMWGTMTTGDCGIGHYQKPRSPEPITLPQTFDAVTLYGALAAGQAWMWGMNSMGELGNQTTTINKSPVAVVGAHSFVQLVRVHGLSGGFCAGRKANGEIWTWGYNGNGQLGDYTTTSRSSPVLVVGAHSFVGVAIGQGAAYGLKANGELWAWGQNTAGQLGDYTMTNRSSPVLVVGAHSFIAVAAWQYQCLALKANGEAWSWGDNTAGNLGTGNRTSYSSPVLVVGGHSFIAVGGQQGARGFGLKANGELWAWGINDSGQLGTGNRTSYSSPVQVVGAHSFVTFACANFTSFGLKANGELWSWGYNAQGALGVDSLVSYSSPVQVVGNHSFLAISAGHNGSGDSVYALKATGQLWTWGDQDDARPNPLAWNQGLSSPLAVVGNHSFVRLATTSGGGAGLKDNGEVWTWGTNTSGQLGANSTASDTASPVQVVGAHSFIDVTAGQGFFVALKANGEAWAWGINTAGNLGDQSTTARSSPVPVVGAHSFVHLRAGYTSVAGLKANGEVWTWGNNSHGQLGTDNRTSYSSPVLVVGGHSFIMIDVASSGSTGGTALGLKANGEVWTWGSNSAGQLGWGSPQSRSSPVQVVGNHSFVRVIITGSGTTSGAVCAGLKANGEVWTWGHGAAGQLGDQTTTSKDSPVQVVGAHSFIDVGGNQGGIFGLKANGEVWTWGYNLYGRLGTGNTTSYSSPVLVLGSGT